jgi:PAS domain S-box-containing protein
MFATLTLFLDTTGPAPRWQTGEWPAAYGWLHIIADLATFAAFTTIPLVLASVLRRKEVPFPRLLWLFCSFLFTCGLVQLLDALVFWVPLHGLWAWIKLLTAVAAVIGAVALVLTVPRVLALPSPRVLEAEVERRLQQLRDSEAQMRAIVETAADGIMTLDDSGTVQSVNRAAGRLFGMEPAAMLGQPLIRFLTSGGGDDLRRGPADTGESKIFGLGGETLGRRPDGSTFPVSISMSRVRTQQGGLLTVIVHDLSDLKKTEEALRHSEARLRMMLDQVPAVLCSTDRELRVTLLSSSAGTGLSGAGLGHSRSRFAGTPLSEVAEVLPFLPVPAFQRALRGESATTEVQRDDRTLEFLIEPLRDGAGVILGAVGVGIDVTERKRDDQARAFYAAQLRERNEMLLRSNQELDEFAYIASHDLREPLRGISNYASFLIEDHGDHLDADGRSKLETLKQLAQRMDALIESLLQFSRAGRVDLAVQETDLNEVVAEVLDSLQISLEMKHIEVRFDHSLPTLRCDRVRLAEVFRNLITNAIKYNDKPHKWIEIGVKELEPPAPGERGRRGARVLYVRDNGIGISPQHHDAIFRIFKRLHGRDKYGGGTGAGLTIVKKIVERHGGRVWLESAPGQGSTFYFTVGDRAGVLTDAASALIR